MTLTSTVAALAMAFGAPLVYADQAWSIQKKRNSEGFSKDVCAVLLIANICRLFFWLGERYEFALLLQSILMIAAQLFLLSLLIKFRPGSYASSAFSVGSHDRSDAATRSAPSAHAPSASNATEAHADASSVSAPDFSADDAFDAPSLQDNGSGEQVGSIQGLFSKGPSQGRYAPLLGLSFPPAPTLGGDEEDQEEHGDENAFGFGARLQRARRKTVRFVLGGLKREEGEVRRDGSSGGRLFGFWTWPDYSSYMIFLAGLVAFLGVLHLLLGSMHWYIFILGMFALGLEGALPVPQAVQNQQRKSLSGFRITVLLGWLGGDLYKTVYFFLNGSPVQFIISGLFALSVDVVICAQLYFFREQTAQDDQDAHAAQAEALEAGQRQQAPIEDYGPAPQVVSRPTSKAQSKALYSSASKPQNVTDETSRFQIEADDDEDEEDGDVGRTRR